MSLKLLVSFTRGGKKSNIIVATPGDLWSIALSFTGKENITIEEYEEDLVCQKKSKSSRKSSEKATSP